MDDKKYIQHHGNYCPKKKHHGHVCED